MVYFWLTREKTEGEEGYQYAHREQQEYTFNALFTFTLEFLKDLKVKSHVKCWCSWQGVNMSLLKYIGLEGRRGKWELYLSYRWEMVRCGDIYCVLIWRRSGTWIMSLKIVLSSRQHLKSCAQAIRAVSVNSGISYVTFVPQDRLVLQATVRSLL